MRKGYAKRNRNFNILKEKIREKEKKTCATQYIFQFTQSALEYDYFIFCFYRMRAEMWIIMVLKVRLNERKVKWYSIIFLKCNLYDNHVSHTNIFVSSITWIWWWQVNNNSLLNFIFKLVESLRLETNKVIQYFTEYVKPNKNLIHMKSLF